ncbi:MAG: hypothetical protein WC992_08215 [Acholeplasmataceae bacterium]
MKYVDIHSFDTMGYQKLFAFNSWRVAMLNYIDELEIDNINFVEAHDESDEAFVLLQGSCILYFAHVEQDRITGFSYQNLEPNKVYRIPKGIFHTHTLSHDAKVLVIEEENTSDINSPRIYLNFENKKMLYDVYREASDV